ncbi:hypothetical protein [Isobaculum melis]|uniref:hypothetical protein n=1 Tax=Isobaculum melis TaxID=142588 RepID=UPI000B861370|nr:hypothetical protein [Isobaculum melis]
MKNRKIYKLLTILGACFLFLGMPINRLYIGNTKGILKRCLTLNYLFFGAWSDLFYMDKTFDEAMTSRGFVNTTRRSNE